MGFFSWAGNGIRSLGQKVGRAAGGVASLGSKALKGFNNLGGKLSKFAHSDLGRGLLDAAELSGIPIVSQLAGGLRVASDVGDKVLKVTNRAEKIMGQGQRLAGRVKQQLAAPVPMVPLAPQPMVKSPTKMAQPSIQKASPVSSVTPQNNSILTDLLS